MALAPGRNTQLLLVLYNGGVDVWDSAEGEVSCLNGLNKVNNECFTKNEILFEGGNQRLLPRMFFTKFLTKRDLLA